MMVWEASQWLAYWRRWNVEKVNRERNLILKFLVLLFSFSISFGTDFLVEVLTFRSNCIQDISFLQVFCILTLSIANVHKSIANQLVYSMHSIICMPIDMLGQYLFAYAIFIEISWFLCSFIWFLRSYQKNPFSVLLPT